MIGIEESKKEKDQNKERLANGEFKILVTTSMFLYKNVDLIPRDFSFILSTTLIHFENSEEYRQGVVFVGI